MLGLTPSSFAISETVFEPRAIRRRTASFLNESGRFFLCCIGGTPTRVIPSGMSTKAGQAQVAVPDDFRPRLTSLPVPQSALSRCLAASWHVDAAPALVNLEGSSSYFLSGLNHAAS